MGYRCPACGQTFETYHKFWSHVASKHMDDFYGGPDQYLESSGDE